MSGQELCLHCGCLRQTVVIEHSSGTEWKCAVCGAQVDFMHNDEDDYPPNLCHICSCPLPPECDDQLCSACEEEGFD